MTTGSLIRRNGGLAKTVSVFFRSNFRFFWRLLSNLPLFGGWLNQYFTAVMLNKFVEHIPRIPRMNLEHDYASMDVAYDESRTVYSRVLPRKPEYSAQLPPLNECAKLFERIEFVPDTNTKVNVLISYYAQWFSHQFFNTNPRKSTRVNQPVGINLGQLYGSSPEKEAEVRSYKDGLLRSTFRHGKEFPEIVEVPEGNSFYKGSHMFVMPIALANMIPGFGAIHVLFFRHHQYVAKRIKAAAEKSGRIMSDEEIFHKAKMVMAFTVIKITMNDYVAEGLQSSHLKVRFDPTVKQSAVFKFFGPSDYPPVNAIQTEFNLLYRWHHLYPDTLKIICDLPKQGKETVREIDYYKCDELKFPEVGTSLSDDWNTVDVLTKDPDSLERVLFSASSTRAGRIELLNVNKWLVHHVVRPGLQKTRDHEMASYNDYREHFGFGRLTKFEDISDNKVLTDMLKATYKTVDNIEYYPGIFAEQKDFGGVHGPLLSGIGVGFTYSGIFASRMWEFGNAEHLTEEGMKLLEEVSVFQDITKLHTELGDANMSFKV